MLVKVFSQGKNSAKEPIDYLLKEKDSLGNKREPPPEILKGDSIITARLIDSLDFIHKYNSGVLSFAPEDQPDREKLLSLIEDFEKYAFAGLEEDQYNSLWVLHRHTKNNRIELHFLMPRVELNTGKSLNPFPPGFHHYFNPWRDYWNLKEGWASPSDPERQRLLQPKFSAFLAHKKILPSTEKQAIHDYLVECVQAGRAKDRNDLIRIIKEDLNLEISRQGKKSFSIRNPDSQKKNIRFEGAMYDEQWRFTEKNPGEERGTEEDRERERSRILEDLESRVREKFRKRFEQNQSYYRAKEKDNRGLFGVEGNPINPEGTKASDGFEETVNSSNPVNFDSWDDDNSEIGIEFEDLPSEDPNQSSESIIKETYKKIEGLEDERRTRQPLLDRLNEIGEGIRRTNESNEKRSFYVAETKRNAVNTSSNINETSRRIAEINRNINEIISRNLAAKKKKELFRQEQLIRQRSEELLAKSQEAKQDTTPKEKPPTQPTKNKGWER